MATETRISSEQAKEAIYKINKLSEKGMTPEQIADAVEKVSLMASSASEIDAVVESSTTNIKTYYISNNGLDTNNGLTHLTPFKTIAKALTLISDYTTLKFECGSIFYESLVYQHSNLTFESYGVGNKPVIDGSSVIATPTLVSGNVWQTTNTYNTSSDGRVVIYENGVPMQPVANQAECEALPNSYVTTTYDSVVSGTYTTMFHASDSLSPLINNKKYRTNTFDCIKPLNDIVNRNNIKIKNLEARYGFTGTPMVVSHGYNNIIEGCYGRFGNKHNIFISANGVGKNLVAYGSELQGQYGRTATLYVAYHANPGANSNYVWENCVAIMDLKKQGIAQGLSQVAFLDHAGIGYFSKGTLNGCYVRGCAGGFGLRANNVEVNNCYFEKLSTKCLMNASSVTSIKNSFFQTNFTTNETANEYGNVTYKNTTFINHRYANCNTATMNINNCLFFGGTSLARSEALMASSGTNGALSLKLNNSIIFGYNNFTHGVTGTDYQGDYNIFFRFYGQIRAWYNGVQYQTLATWQTATGQDANSVYLTDAQSKTFFLTDPSTGVVTINPYAQVTGGNGTVYTGTFPDGTLLTYKFTNKNYTHLKSKYIDELDLLQYQN